MYLYLLRYWAPSHFRILNSLTTHAATINMWAGNVYVKGGTWNLSTC